MIEKLEELTVAQFVDLLCGDTSVLASEHEATTVAETTAAAKNIIYEYRAIADSSGAKKHISDAEEFIKAKINLTIFSMCKNLSVLGEYDCIRIILDECSIKTAGKSDERILAEVKSGLERAKSIIAEYENDNDAKTDMPPTDIRRNFDAQTALLMTHFRFQIDTTTMKASVYAHLVARRNLEAKAQIAALRKRHGRY